MSPSSVQQGNTIPGMGHLKSISSLKGCFRRILKMDTLMDCVWAFCCLRVFFASSPQILIDKTRLTPPPAYLFHMSLPVSCSMPSASTALSLSLQATVQQHLLTGFGYNIVCRRPRCR